MFFLIAKSKVLWVTYRSSASLALFFQDLISRCEKDILLFRKIFQYCVFFSIFQSRREKTIETVNDKNEKKELNILLSSSKSVLFRVKNYKTFITKFSRKVSFCYIQFDRMPECPFMIENARTSISRFCKNERSTFQSSSQSKNFYF